MARHHRFTIKELTDNSDYRILSILVSERMESTTNKYAPLYKRLHEIGEKLNKKEELTR
jgi:hypothetical protein